MLTVKNLCKEYPGFRLKDVSFDLPEGYIMGFVGANGAGKTTTLKSILNLTRPDGGEIIFKGRPVSGFESEFKQDVGFMLGEFNFYPRSTVSLLAGVYSRFFRHWDGAAFDGYMKRFKLDPAKKVAEYSTGMRVKLALALALSHKASLLIFDEPTSGLDPIARDEILDIFRAAVNEGGRSLLFSTHITSDLDKCADLVMFIKDGGLKINAAKDELLDGYFLVAGKNSELTEGLKSRLVGFKPNSFGFTGLIRRKDIKKEDGLQTAKPNIEDIMIYLYKDGKEL